MGPFKARTMVYLAILASSSALWLIRMRPDNSQAGSHSAQDLLDPARLEAIADKLPAVPATSKVGIGLLYLQKGQVTDAQRILEETVRSDPKNADAWLHLGRLHKGQAQYTPSAEALENAVRLRPDWGAAHNELAVVYDELERHDEALSEYEIASRLEPSNEIIQSNLRTAKEDAELRSAPPTVIEMPTLTPPPAPVQGVRIEASSADPIKDPDAVFQRPLKITLMNGRVLVGDIVDKNDEALWLRVAGSMKVKLKRGEVLRIEDAS